MSDDRERLERYLDWQRAHGKDRAGRRRRWITRAAVAVLVGVGGAGLAAWLAGHSTHAVNSVATRPAPAVPVRIAPLPESSPGEPPPIAPAEPPAPARPAPRGGRDAPRRSAPLSPPPDSRAPQRTRPAAEAPTLAVPELSSPPAAVRAEAVESPDVAAGVAPTPEPPVPVTSMEPPIDIREPQVGTPAPAAAATAPPRVPESVAGWVEGEVQEFRDGIKREIGDFRAGYEVVRRRVRDLGSKLRK
jgi:hypothetical protein